MLERVSPGPIGFERRLFECPRCDHKPHCIGYFQSNAAGWLAGELRGAKLRDKIQERHMLHTKPGSAMYGFTNEIDGNLVERGGSAGLSDQ